MQLTTNFEEEFILPEQKFKTFSKPSNLFNQKQKYSICKMSNHDSDSCRLKNDNRFCTFCKIKGHTLENCRKSEKPVRQAKITCDYCKKLEHDKNSRFEYKRDQEHNENNSEKRQLMVNCDIKLKTCM